MPRFDARPARSAGPRRAACARACLFVLPAWLGWTALAGAAGLGTPSFTGIVPLQPPSTPTNITTDTRLQNDGYELRGHFQGRYPGAPQTPGQDVVQGRLQTLFVEGVDLQRGLMGRLGRQAIDSSAIDAAFDGVSAGVDLPGALRLRAASGYPVATNHPGTLDTSRYFYTVSLALHRPHRLWSGRAFALGYRSGPDAGRTRVGGALRYGRPNRWLLGWADYDTVHARLDEGFVFGRWAAAPGSAVSLLFDYRGPEPDPVPRVPLWQRIRSLGVPAFDERTDPALDLGTDGTFRRAMLIGVSRRVSSDLLFRGAFGLSDACQANPAFADTIAPGHEYRYVLDLTRTGALGRSTSMRLQMRLCDAYGPVTSFRVGGHYPTRSGLRLDPALALEVTADSGGNGGRQWTLIPSLGLTYHLSASRRLEARAGGAWSNGPAQGIASIGEGYYLHVAYQAAF